jgi:hypothetical protein
VVDTFDLRSLLDMYRVFERFQTISKLQTRIKTREEFERVETFSITDLASLSPKVKALYVFSYTKVRPHGQLIVNSQRVLISLSKPRPLL